METPETRYAKTDHGLNLAYQVVGDGPLDIVFPGSGGLLPIDLIMGRAVYRSSVPSPVLVQPPRRLRCTRDGRIR